MSEVTDLRPCSACKVDVTPVASDRSGGGDFCPYCGHDLKRDRKAAGPFSFMYESVPDAYQPSGIVPGGARLKMTLRAVGIGLLSVPAAYIAYIVAIFILRLLYRLLGGMGICVVNVLLLIAMILANAVPAIVMGALVGAAVDRAALKNKVRSVRAGRLPGFLGGLVAAVVYPTLYLLILRLTTYSPLNGIEGMTRSETVILILQALGTLAIAFLASVELSAGKKPFCEECAEFMTQHTLPARHVRFEQTMMNALRSGDHAPLKSIPLPDDLLNKSQIVFWSCGCEQGGGFGYLNTTLTRYEYDGENPQPKMAKDSSGNITGPAAEVQTRMVFSERIDYRTAQSLQGVLKADQAAEAARKAAAG